MKKILVTGANGFLARTLIELAIKRDILVFGLSTSYQKIYDPLYEHIEIDKLCHFEAEWLADEVERMQPDCVFHFAGDPRVSSTKGIIESNTLVTNNILKLCKNCNFVFASSAILYGSSFSNTGFSINDAVNLETLYAVTKKHCEDLVSYYSVINNLSGLSLRYVATVGRNATHGAIPDIIRKLDSRDSSIELFGSYPGSSKPYLWADQSMDITLNLGLSKLPRYSVLNVSPVDSISIDEIVDTVVNFKKISTPKKVWNPQAVWRGDQRNLNVRSEFNLLSSKEAIIAALGEL